MKKISFKCGTEVSVTSFRYIRRESSSCYPGYHVNKHDMDNSFHYNYAYHKDFMDKIKTQDAGEWMKYLVFVNTDVLLNNDLDNAYFCWLEMYSTSPVQDLQGYMDSIGWVAWYQKENPFNELTVVDRLKEMNWDYIGIDYNM